MLEFDKNDKTAVIVIDMQEDFVRPGAELAVVGGMDIIPNIDKLLKLARAKGMPIIYTQEMHRPDRSDFGIEGYFEPLHCVEGTKGVEILEELKPQDGDFIVKSKRRYDAMLGTEMDLLLRNLGVKNLIFTGVCTDICVINTIYTCRNLDYKVCLPVECTAGTTKERYEAALKVIEYVFAKVTSLEETIKLFGLEE